MNCMSCIQLSTPLQTVCPCQKSGLYRAWEAGELSCWISASFHGHTQEDFMNKLKRIRALQRQLARAVSKRPSILEALLWYDAKQLRTGPTGSMGKNKNIQLLFHSWLQLWTEAAHAAHTWSPMKGILCPIICCHMYRLNAGSEWFWLTFFPHIVPDRYIVSFMCANTAATAALLDNKSRKAGAR